MPADEHERSSTPWLLLVVNAPPDKRHELGYATVLTIIGGNVKAPGQKRPYPLDPNHALALIKDELVFLEKYGKRVYDAHDKTWFDCRVKTIAIISDFRGLHHQLALKVGTDAVLHVTLCVVGTMLHGVLGIFAPIRERFVGTWKPKPCVPASHVMDRVLLITEPQEAREWMAMQKRPMYRNVAAGAPNMCF